MEICKKDECTGCGACAFSCPKECISMQENEIGIVYPIVDESKCIHCHKCQKVCPSLSEFEFHAPLKAYAAWSSNPDERKSSASGGIAAEIYNYAMKNKFVAVGAVSNSDFSVSLKEAYTPDECKPFKNSKYVFSTAYSLYPKLKELLAQKCKVVVIGLPCQIAAIKNLYHDDSNLYLIDVVCHGTTPFSYLKQHITMLENQYQEKAKIMSFRDAEKNTYTYTFTLYNSEGDCFYSARTKDGDSYQIGYHRTISYRENCYHCRYARSERISDITLSDYKGLGTIKPWDMDTNEVSCVLVHTERGQTLIRELIQNNQIIAYERPIEEPINADPQLQHPSLKTESRYDFERQIQLEHGDFEKAMKFVIKKRNQKEKKQQLIETIKKPLRKIKRLIKRG